MKSFTAIKTLLQQRSERLRYKASQKSFERFNAYLASQELVNIEFPYGSNTSRLNLARDPETSPGMLGVLSNDENEWVRVGVAVNLSTPVDILSMLSTDTSSNVRDAVATNPHCPVIILFKLIDDDDYYVKTMAMDVLTQVSNQKLVWALRDDFPEVTEEMPKEWLLALVTIAP